MVHKRKVKTKCKRRSKICTYRMNETSPKTYWYLLKKEGMPSEASPRLDDWVSLNIYLGFPGHPQAWALASPHSSHINTSSIFEHFIYTKLNKILVRSISIIKQITTLSTVSNHSYFIFALNLLYSNFTVAYTYQYNP